MAGKRVLVIDDHGVLRGALSRWLTPYAAVDAVGSYEEALLCIALAPAYDHILCELEVAGASIEGFHERLRHLSPSLAERLIFMSAGAPASVFDLVVRTGRPFLAKPFDMHALVELIAGVRAAS